MATFTRERPENCIETRRISRTHRRIPFHSLLHYIYRPNERPERHPEYPRPAGRSPQQIAQVIMPETYLAVERVQTVKSKQSSSPPAAAPGGIGAPAPSSIDGNPYILVSPVPASKFSMEVVLKALSRCGKKLEDSSRKAGEVAEGVWRHLNTNPNLTEAAMTRLLQQTKVLIEGGYDKIFQQVFGFVPGEKLQVAYICYLSMSSGPMMGTIYISTSRMAFCSDNPLHRFITPEHQELIYYKVIVPFEKIKAINSSSNKANPAEKYIQVIARDGYEFWFMGFVSYDKAFKRLKEAMKY